MSGLHPDGVGAAAPLPADREPAIVPDHPARVVNLRQFASGGWGRVVLPPDVIRVDRRSRWGNPFRIGDTIPPNTLITLDLALWHFRRYAEDMLDDDSHWLDALHGKRLACWCWPEACHANILVELGA